VALLRVRESRRTVAGQIDSEHGFRHFVGVSLQVDAAVLPLSEANNYSESLVPN